MKRRPATGVLAALGLLLLLLFGLDGRFLSPPLVIAVDGAVLHAYLNPSQKWRMKSELTDITPVLRAVIIEKEDRYFRWHFGVNSVAVV